MSARADNSEREQMPRVGTRQPTCAGVSQSSRMMSEITQLAGGEVGAQEARGSGWREERRRHLVQASFLSCAAVRPLFRNLVRRLQRICRELPRATLLAAPSLSQMYRIATWLSSVVAPQMISIEPIAALDEDLGSGCISRTLSCRIRTLCCRIRTLSYRIRTYLHT